MALSALVDDVILSIMEHLWPNDILALRKTCRNLCRISKLKRVWTVVLQQASQSRKYLLPIYHQPLLALSSHQLECLVLHVLRLQHRMDNKRGPLSTVSFHRPRPVTWVQIIHGRWLLVASSDSSTSVLSLWSLTSVHDACSNTVPPIPLAEAYLEGPVAEGLVTVDNGEIFIALDIRSPNPWTEILTLSGSEGTGSDCLVFTRVVRLSGVSHIRCLDPKYLGFALRNEISIPHLVDWRSGVVMQLAAKPSLLGGCIAMAVSGNMVAAVSPGNIELYLIESPNHKTRKIHKWKILTCIGSAIVTFNAPHEAGHDSRHHHPPHSAPRTLRLCIMKNEEVYVYEVQITSEQQELPPDLREIWHHGLRKSTQFCYPKFGSSPMTLTWYSTPGKRRGPVWFMTSRIPTASRGKSPDTLAPSQFKFYDVSMPALYCFGVRDYDETRGVLAIGNSFGELVVYDFSGSNPNELEDCFKTFRLSPISGREVMSKTPVPSRAAAPYPYSRLSWPTREGRSSVIGTSRPYQPENLPDGWTTNFIPDNNLSDDDEFKAPWARLYAVVCSSAWWVEYGRHYLGTQRPIMHVEEEFTVYRAGGLLFFDNYESNFLDIMQDNDYSIDDILRICAREMTILSVRRCESGSMLWNVRRRFVDMWRWEWAVDERNRWQELKDRGGEVDASWLGDGPDDGPWPGLISN